MQSPSEVPGHLPNGWSETPPGTSRPDRNHPQHNGQQTAGLRGQPEDGGLLEVAASRPASGSLSEGVPFGSLTAGALNLHFTFSRAFPPPGLYFLVICGLVN